jgi:hypothetical protein
MKTTTLTVAAAAIVMFAQSASAREHHHGHYHHYHHMAAARGAFGQTGSADPTLPNGLFGFAAANASFDRTVSTLSCGRTTSERSSVNKTANGSSSQAMTAMRFAPALARSPARLRSDGVNYAA